MTLMEHMVHPKWLNDVVNCNITSISVITDTAIEMRMCEYNSHRLLKAKNHDSTENALTVIYKLRRHQIDVRN